MKKSTFNILLGFVIGALFSYLVFYQFHWGNKPPEMTPKPAGLISVKQAKQLNNNWTNTRKSAVDSVAKKYGVIQDNRNAWWSVDAIEDFIAISREQANTLGYDLTGLRIYLGVYSGNAGQGKDNLTTMFMVPTGKKQHADASSIPILNVTNKDLLIEALNDGSGNPQSYPQ